MMRKQEENHGHEDQQSRVINELSALVLNLLRSPPMPFADQSPMPMRRSHQPVVSSTTISPLGFSWLMLGISVSTMLCGSVTFFIGFMLMPWVIGLIMVFYAAGVVSMISMLARSILCYVISPSPRKNIPEWKLLLREKVDWAKSWDAMENRAAFGVFASDAACCNILGK